MISLRSGLAWVLIAAGVLGCSDDELGPRVPASVAVTPAALQVLVGGTLQMTATVLDASGQEIADAPVTFRSGNPTVLTVDDTGLLTSVGSIGTSVITAASGEISAEVEVEVAWPPSAVVVNPRTLDLDTQGDQVTVRFTVTNENGVAVPDPAITVESSDPSVVLANVSTTNEFIFVTGLDAGSATVTLTAGARSADIAVTVAQHAASVGITPTSLVFPAASGSQQATAALLDRTGDPMDQPGSFTWSSSDESVAVVGSSGMVTAIGLGSAVITATTDTFTGRLGVFVGTPPAGELVARVPFTQAKGLAVTPDGRYFVTGLNSFATGALPDFVLTTKFETSAPLVDVALNTAADRAYVAREMGQNTAAIVVFDLITDALRNILPISTPFPAAVAISPDSTTLLIGSTGGFEARSEPSSFSYGMTTVGQIEQVTHHPSRPLFYASGANGVFEVESSAGALTRRFRAGAVSHVVSPDGTRLYTVSLGDGIRVWNLDTGVEEPRLAMIEGTDLAVSPEGRFLYVLFGPSTMLDVSRLYIFDRASGALLRDIFLGGMAQRVGVTGDGTAVITNRGGGGGTDGWVDFVR